MSYNVLRLLTRGNGLLNKQQRLDASVLYMSEFDGRVVIWSLSAAPGAGGKRALGMLVRELAYRDGGRLVIPRVHEAEVLVHVLRGLGFVPGVETVRVVAEAQSRA